MPSGHGCIRKILKCARVMAEGWIGPSDTPSSRHTTIGFNKRWVSPVTPSERSGALLEHRIPCHQSLCFPQGEALARGFAKFGKRVAPLPLDNVRRTLRTNLVVLAAFAIENPRLLLTSATRRHPRGLRNNTDLVGRYVMTHLAGLAYGIFDEETRPYMGAFGGQLINQDGYAKLTHANHGAFGSYQWMLAQAVKPNDLLGMVIARLGQSH